MGSITVKTYKLLHNWKKNDFYVWAELGQKMVYTYKNLFINWSKLRFVGRYMNKPPQIADGSKVE